LTSYQEKLSSEKCQEKLLSEKCRVNTGQEVSDGIQDEWLEPERIDIRDILSHSLPSVSPSLYFSLVKECNWHEFLTEV
jgi:hypothetical protein